MEYLTDDDYAIAAQNGISKINAYRRFYTRGWSKEKTITQPITEINNLWTKYRDICVVSNSCFYERIKNGMPPEKAATTPPMPREMRGIANPKLSKSMIETAKQNGITYNTLKHRIYHYKWPVEKAMTLPVRSRLKQEV